MKLFFSAPNYRVLVREAEKRAVNLPCLDEAKNITKVTVQNTDIRTGLMCKGCDQKADILVSMLVSVCVFVWSAVCMLRASSVAVIACPQHSPSRNTQTCFHLFAGLNSWTMAFFSRFRMEGGIKGDGRMDTDGGMDGWMDGGWDGEMEGWSDGWIEMHFRSWQLSKSGMKSKNILTLFKGRV